MRFGWLGVALVSAGLCLSANDGSAATVDTIDVGTQISTFSNDVRGFWFTAPTDFWIVGIDVPTDASSANFHAAVLRLPANPPSFPSATSTYDVLYDVRNQATAVSGLSIAVSSGDVIGVLGNRGDVNSYGSGPYVTSILGNPVTLKRFGTQNPLSSLSFNVPVWREPGGAISRVFLTVSDMDPTAPVPLPAGFPMLLAGAGALLVLRRNRRA
ncbi:putative secreted protein [Aliiruegeria haliotis]|uniref:Putative secreted protein n=1 Tax=Aliiruegeria haliotis TaxID=1280846 RepID=A0A2T0RWS5_9RHOB|nr:VPLPA-CTERM sorting domain-containing protein [Aliiruegeria haliotis]PRY25503.1 putative secreted protein [Aliiruegeria haliotis]